MNPITRWLAGILIVCSTSLCAQIVTGDTLLQEQDRYVEISDTTFVAVAGDTIHTATNQQPKFLPDPKKALKLSLLTPGFGGGQIYNRDYWKLPFVYAGYGVSVYFIFLNIDRYGTMVRHYKSFYFLDDPSDPKYGTLNNDIKTARVFIKSQNRYADMSIDQVKRVKDVYRRWRDWSFFALGAVYALAAIEANVAAHMKTFDLSEDLSLRVQPSFVHPQTATPAPGIRLVLLMH